MNKLNKKFGQLLMLFLAAGLWTLTSCGDGHDGHGHDHDHGADGQEQADGHGDDHADDHGADHGDDHADDHAEGHGGEDMDEMESIGATYAEGSMEADLLDFMDNGAGSKTFTLDKIPFEGDEISAEGKAQLDAIAEMLKNHPDLTMEIQGHTRQADNAVGRTAKKTASGARAAWVKTKLVFRGVDGKQLSTKGYADEMLLPELDPKDDGQRRLTMAMTK